MRPTTATDTVNNSHPRFVRLPPASRASLDEVSLWKDSLAHSVHGTFHDAPYASATSSRLSRGVLFHDETISAMTFQFVISSNPLLTPLSPRRTPARRWTNGHSGLAKIVSHALLVKKRVFRDPRRLPSIDLSSLSPPRRLFGLSWMRSAAEMNVSFRSVITTKPSSVTPKLMVDVDLTALPP